ncbi:MAG: T9SS type A sorting domain-containing protein [Flavobacteriales bacterium]|nr:T9SS type A sorting domain-containing protein [Flavobacteriales bacterium]
MGTTCSRAPSCVALSALNPDNVVEPIVMKVDPMGVLLWSNKLSALPALGGQGITNDHVRNRIMPDGTMMLLLTSVDQPSTGLQLVHADASGIPLNAINLRNNTVPSYVTAMALLPDNSVALAGYNNPGTYVSSTFLTHTDETGHTACNDTASTSVAVAFEPPTNAGGVVASACTFTYTDITPATPAVVMVVHHACSGTGIHDLAAQQPTLTLYPNPASTNVQVRLEGLPTSGSTVVLFDATGAVVRTMAMGDSMAYLDVQDLSPGIHLVRWMGRTGAWRSEAARARCPLTTGDADTRAGPGHRAHGGCTHLPPPSSARPAAALRGVGRAGHPGARWRWLDRRGGEEQHAGEGASRGPRPNTL